MFTQGPYLRVLTPRTTNGNNPQIGPDGRIEYKETHLPLTAKLKLEAYNLKLVPHLRKIIEVVNGDTKQSQNVQQKTIDELRKQLDEQKALIEKLLTAQSGGSTNMAKPQSIGATNGGEKDQPSAAVTSKPVQTIKPQPIK